jgi:DNA-binding NarL/FixJ family response regulator
MLFRSATGFTEDERQVLALLRPHLAGVLRRHEPVRADRLTDRHWELLRLVAAGHTNSQIATALHLSPHTVRTHLEHVYARLQVRSRAEAVTYAFGGRGTAAQSLD